MSQPVRTRPRYADRAHQHLNGTAEARNRMDDPTTFPAATARTAWEDSITHILRAYQTGTVTPIPTQHNTNAIELVGARLFVRNVNAREQFSGLYPNQEWAREYISNLLDQRNRGQVYSRLTKYQDGPIDVNQENTILEELRSQWFSRRAIISFWQPSVDGQSAYPPCLCTLQFLIRDERLHLTAQLRSNDAWICGLPDMIAFMRYQKRIARKLDLKPGSYTHIAQSYHIYEHDLPVALTRFRERLA